MDSLYIRAILSGIFFGAWPLLMNRSGLNGNVSAFVLTSIVLICVFPFAFGSMGTIFSANWVMVIGAGILGAAGGILFNGMIVKAVPENLGSLFVLMLIVQIAVPAIYQVAVGGITAAKGIGFILAAVAALLLLI